MENKEIIFGRNPVLEYLQAAAAGDKNELFVSKNAHGKIIDTIVNEARSKKIKITFKEKDFFKSLGASSKHQGIALKIAQKTKKTGESELLEKAAESKGVLVLLDQITDPHNAGSIIRTAEAMGCCGIIIPKSNSTGITGIVIKSSAGATAYIDIITISNVSAFLEKAKESGFWIIGTSDHGNTGLSQICGIKPAVVVIGSEGTGMRRLTEEKCDYLVNIPMKGKISSLNASVAAGIVIYEIMKPL